MRTELDKEAIIDHDKTHAIVFPDMQAIGGSSFSKQSLIDEGFKTYADTLRMAVLRFDDNGRPGILRNVRYPSPNNERVALIESIIRIARPAILEQVNAMTDVSIRDVHAALNERLSKLEMTELPTTVVCYLKVTS